MVKYLVFFILVFKFSQIFYVQVVSQHQQLFYVQTKSAQRSSFYHPCLSLFSSCFPSVYSTLHKVQTSLGWRTRSCEYEQYYVTIILLVCFELSQCVTIFLSYLNKTTICAKFDSLSLWHSIYLNIRGGFVSLHAQLSGSHSLSISLSLLQSGV